MSETFKGMERQVKWQIIPHADETKIHFGDRDAMAGFAAAHG
jgi:hypothetical protein